MNTPFLPYEAAAEPGSPSRSSPPKTTDKHARRAWTDALEAALVRQLLAAWHQVNLRYFRGALTPPTLSLTDAAGRLGVWRRATRALEISRPLVLEQPWGIVVEVLKHEIAHQYAYEVLKATDETAHGQAFRTVCERLGIDPSASGLPTTPDASTNGANAGPADGAEGTQARAVQRIARLLALAESPNQHEAEAAMAAAQRLMLKYNIESAKETSARAYAFKQLGEVKGRVTESERLVAMVLGKFFFVEVIWVPAYRPADGKTGSILEICGSAANLAMAEYVHSFLNSAAESLWRQHQREKAIASNRDRRVFLSGVMSGFAEKLAREQVRQASEGLVWVKDGDLGNYFRQRHPYIRHVRHDGAQKNQAYAEGKAAGRNLVLRRAMEAATTSQGLALPPGPSRRR